MTKEIILAEEDAIVKHNLLKALSGEQILDLLVSVADETSKLFDVNMLYNPAFNNFSYSEGTFMLLVSKALGNLGIPRELVQGKYEPPFGMMDEHTVKLWNLKKSDLETVLNSMAIVENGLFEKTGEEDLIGIEYNIKFPWGCSDNYFDKKLCQQYFKGVFEELKLPQSLARLISSVYVFKMRLSGMKEEGEVVEDILELVKKISPEGMNVLDKFSGKYDAFSYKRHAFMFKLRHSQLGYFNGYPQICWAYALYNSKLSLPIAYSIIKSKEAKEQKLLEF